MYFIQNAKQSLNFSYSNNPISIQRHQSTRPNDKAPASNRLINIKINFPPGNSPSPRAWKKKSSRSINQRLERCGAHCEQRRAGSIGKSMAGCCRSHSSRTQITEARVRFIQPYTRESVGPLYLGYSVETPWQWGSYALGRWIFIARPCGWIVHDVTRVNFL